MIPHGPPPPSIPIPVVRSSIIYDTDVSAAAAATTATTTCDDSIVWNTDSNSGNNNNMEGTTSSSSVLLQIPATDTRHASLPSEIVYNDRGCYINNDSDGAININAIVGGSSSLPTNNISLVLLNDPSLVKGNEAATDSEAAMPYSISVCDDEIDMESIPDSFMSSESRRRIYNDLRGLTTFSSEPDLCTHLEEDESIGSDDGNGTTGASRTMPMPAVDCWSINGNGWTGLGSSSAACADSVGSEMDDGIDHNGIPYFQEDGGCFDTAVDSFQWQRGTLIGAGAFGKVYQGLNQNTGELMAVKQVSVDEKASGGQVRAMEREIQLLRSLEHENIVKYLGCELDERRRLLNVFLEYVPGGSIASLIVKFGQLSLKLCRVYTRQILSGLAYLHEHSIVHLDIKGANILVDNSGTVKLADFGAAGHLSVSLSIKALGSMRGTPYWMAPEVIKQRGYSASADVWSLGCTVLEMATGKPPWSEYSDPIAAMFQIASTKALPSMPAECVPDSMRFFVKRCLKRNTARRSTIAQLLEHDFVNVEKMQRRNVVSRSPSVPRTSGSTMAMPITTTTTQSELTPTFSLPGQARSFSLSSFANGSGSSSLPASPVRRDNSNVSATYQHVHRSRSGNSSDSVDSGSMMGGRGRRGSMPPFFEYANFRSGGGIVGPGVIGCDEEDFDNNVKGPPTVTRSFSTLQGSSRGFNFAGNVKDRAQHQNSTVASPSAVPQVSSALSSPSLSVPSNRPTAARLRRALSTPNSCMLGPASCSSMSPQPGSPITQTQQQQPQQQQLQQLQSQANNTGAQSSQMYHIRSPFGMNFSSRQHSQPTSPRRPSRKTSLNTVSSGGGFSAPSSPAPNCSIGSDSISNVRRTSVERNGAVIGNESLRARAATASLVPTQLFPPSSPRAGSIRNGPSSATSSDSSCCGTYPLSNGRPLSPRPTTVAAQASPPCVQCATTASNSASEVLSSLDRAAAAAAAAATTNVGAGEMSVDEPNTELRRTCLINSLGIATATSSIVASGTPNTPRSTDPPLSPSMPSSPLVSDRVVMRSHSARNNAVHNKDIMRISSPSSNFYQPSMVEQCSAHSWASGLNEFSVPERNPSTNRGNRTSMLGVLSNSSTTISATGSSTPQPRVRRSRRNTDSLPPSVCMSSRSAKEGIRRVSDGIISHPDIDVALARLRLGFGQSISTTPITGDQL